MQRVATDWNIHTNIRKGESERRCQIRQLSCRGRDNQSEYVHGDIHMFRGLSADLKITTRTFPSADQRVSFRSARASWTVLRQGCVSSNLDRFISDRYQTNNSTAYPQEAFQINPAAVQCTVQVINGILYRIILSNQVNEPSLES